jgi:hypothetical protein
MAGALREVAAAFGVQFDTAALAKGDAAVKSVTARLAALGKQTDALRIAEAQAALAKAQGAKNVDQLAVQKAELQLAQAQLEVERKAEEQAKATASARTARYGAVAAAVTVVAAAIRSFAADVIAEAHELTRTSAALRVKAQYLQQVRGAFQLAGLSADEASATFATFRRNTMGTRQTLDTVIARLERITSPTARAREAIRIFGEHGRQLLPVLHSGAGGLADLRKEFEELGGGLSDEAIASARGLELGLTRFRFAGDAVRSQLATGLLPTLAMLVDAARGATAWFARMLRGTETLRNVLYMLGAVAGFVGLRLLAPFLPAAIAIAAVILVVDDLITMFRGGRSVIGGFIDDLFGVGSAQAVVRAVGDAIAWIEQKALAAGAAITRLLEQMGIIESAEQRIARSDAAIRASFEADQRRRARTRRDTGLAEADTRAQLPAGARLGRTPTASGTIPVAVRLPAAAGARTTTITQTNAPQVHIHGVADPRRAADLAVEEIDRRARAAADAAHPLSPRDES